MASQTYQFRPMSASDLPLVLRWLAEPHVVEWWGDTRKQFEMVSNDLHIRAMDQYIVETGGRPFAYIQCYDPAKWPEGGLGKHPAGTRGVDQFIGETDMTGRGHGSAFLRAFAERELAARAPRIITDPDPNNARAIRAYEKAGFHRNGLVSTSEGPALLMVRDA